MQALEIAEEEALDDQRVHREKLPHVARDSVIGRAQLAAIEPRRELLAQRGDLGLVASVLLRVVPVHFHSPRRQLVGTAPASEP